MHKCELHKYLIFGTTSVSGIPMEHCNVCYFSHPVICILLFVAITESEGEDGCKQQPVYSHSKVMQCFVLKWKLFLTP
jgi:hypothetical protein